MATLRRPSSISTMPNTEYTDQNNNNDGEGDSRKYCYKIITLGNVGIGKSTLISTYTQPGEEWDNDPFQFVIEKHITMGDKTIKLDIWDTAGKNFQFI